MCPTELSLCDIEACVPEHPAVFSSAGRHAAARHRPWSRKEGKAERTRAARKASSARGAGGRGRPPRGGASSDSQSDGGGAGVREGARHASDDWGVPRVGLTRALFGGAAAAAPLTLTPVQLCLLLLGITSGLCHAGGRHGAPHCLAALLAPQLARLLGHTAAQTAGEFGAGWTAADVGVVERQMVRVVVSLAAAAGCHAACLALVQASDCVSVLLDVCRGCLAGDTDGTANGGTTDVGEIHADDRLTRRQTAVAAADSLPDVVPAGQRLWLATDILQGLLLVLARVFAGVASQPATQPAALALLGTVLQQRGLDLLERAVLSRGEGEGLLHALGRVITAVKMSKPRSASPSGEACHHSDALRVAAGGGREACCAVAALAEPLLRLLPASRSPLLTRQLVGCLGAAGLCCCVPPARVIPAFLHPAPLRLRHEALATLGTLLLGQLGGGARTCATCLEHRLMAPTEAAAAETSDSAFSGSEASGVEEGGGRPALPRWHCLAQLQPLVCHAADPRLAVDVTRHVLRLVAEGGAAVRCQLLQQLLLPVLQRGAALPEKVTLYCLSALPLLLGTQHAHDRFLNCGGVRQLVRLTAAPALRAPALRVFQALVLLRDSPAAGPPPDRTVLTTLLDMLFSDDAARWIADTAFQHEALPAAGSSPDELRADLWGTARLLFSASRGFRRDFLRRGGAEAARELLVGALKRLSATAPRRGGAAEGRERHSPEAEQEYSLEGKQGPEAEQGESPEAERGYGPEGEGSGPGADRRKDCHMLLLTCTLDVCLTCCAENVLFDSQVSLRTTHTRAASAMA